MGRDHALNKATGWAAIAPSPRRTDAAADSQTLPVVVSLAGDGLDLLDHDASSIDEQLDAVAKAALKRKRHRDIVARSRMRQRATIEALRAHEAALCKQLNRLLMGYDHRRNLTADDREIGRAVVHWTHAALVKQVTMQERIRQENEFLQDRIDDFARFRQMMESEWRRNALECHASAADAFEIPAMNIVDNTNGGSTRGDSNVISGSKDGSTAGGYWVYFRGHEDPIYYEPLSVQSCEASMQAVYRCMIDLYQDFSLNRIALHETHCFGWKVQRPLRAETDCERRLLRFQFSKTIRCVDDTMDDIVNRTWQAFHDPEQYAKIYSTVVVTRVVQRVNEHMTVLIQNAPNPDGLTNIRYFNILAKMAGFNERRERVVALVKTIMNPTKIDVQPSGTGGGVTAATQPHDIEWMKHGFSFLLLSEVADDHCASSSSTGSSSSSSSSSTAARGERLIKMHYGTHYECVNEAHAQYLMLEVLGLASRWEQLVLPTHHLTF